jgi:hypothetical protein
LRFYEEKHGFTLSCGGFLKSIDSLDSRRKTGKYLTAMKKLISKTYLVGGFIPSEKYYSVGMIIPNIWKNKTCSKPPSRYKSFSHINSTN